MAVIMNRLNKSLIIFCFIYISCSLNEKEILVRNLSQFNQAVSNVIPGSIITMANGEWENVELRLKGIGTKGNPILLRAETPGKVIISGQSNLAFSGEHIIVSDLIFQTGGAGSGHRIRRYQRFW